MYDEASELNNAVTKEKRTSIELERTKISLTRSIHWHSKVHPLSLSLSLFRKVWPKKFCCRSVWDSDYIVRCWTAGGKKNILQMSPQRHSCLIHAHVHHVSSFHVTVDMVTFSLTHTHTFSFHSIVQASCSFCTTSLLLSLPLNVSSHYELCPASLIHEPLSFIMMS